MSKSVGQVFTKEFESVIWIRLEGRGTFQVSPAIKEFAENKIGERKMNLVVDLEGCPGMDSTFMGMLAGIAMQLRRQGGGTLDIVGTSDKTKASLIELGLSHLMNIEAEEGIWIGRLDKARSNLTPLSKDAPKAGEALILECHENLCDADSDNLKKFETVLGVMGSDRISPSNDKLD